MRNDKHFGLLFSSQILQSLSLQHIHYAVLLSPCRFLLINLYTFTNGMALFPCLVQRMSKMRKKPVRVNTSRMPSVRFLIVSLPPLLWTCLSKVSRILKPELLMYSNRAKSSSIWRWACSISGFTSLANCSEAAVSSRPESAPFRPLSYSKIVSVMLYVR